MTLDLPRITPPDVQRAAVMGELGVKPYSTTNWRDLLNPNNIHALDHFGTALGENMFRLYTESRASTEPPADTPFPDDIKVGLQMKIEFLRMANVELAAIEHDIKQGKRGGELMQKALKTAQSEGNPDLIDSMLEGVIWGGANAVKAYSRLTQAANLIRELTSQATDVIDFDKHPEDLAKVLTEALKKPRVANAISTAAYLLAPLVYNYTNISIINKLFDQAAASKRLSAPETLPSTLYNAILLVDVWPLLAKLDAPTSEALWGFLSETNTANTEPKETAALFEQLNNKQRQLILRAILNHPNELTRLGIAIIEAKTSKESRTLYLKLEQDPRQPDGEMRKKFGGETLIIVETPLGKHLAEIHPKDNPSKLSIRMFINPNKPEPPPSGFQSIGNPFEFDLADKPAEYKIIGND